MFEKNYIVGEEHIGITAERIIAGILTGKISIGSSEEVTVQYTTDTIIAISEDSLGDMQVSNAPILNNVRKLISDDAWKHSCLSSARIISKILQEPGDWIVIHNKSKNEFIQALNREVRSLVSEIIGGSLDRWNPADIWLIRNEGLETVRECLKVVSTQGKSSAEILSKITETFNECFDNKTVIGISLKKVKLGVDPELYLVNRKDLGSDSLTVSLDFKHNIDTVDFVRKTDKSIQCTFKGDSRLDGTLELRKDGRVEYRLKDHNDTRLGSSTMLRTVSKLVGTDDDRRFSSELDNYRDILKRCILHCVSEYSQEYAEGDITVTITSAKHYRLM